MPSKPMRPCNKPGCRNLTAERYCAEHVYLAEQQRKERHKRYDEQQRDKQAAAFYKSLPWRRVREQALMRDAGLCQACLFEQRITPADMVHHKVPVKVNWDLRLRLDNLVSLCDRCHAKIDHSKLG
ncbi:HNH endonuclease [Paenibacillus ginsengihumi]|uniref:HNH endonuclease n=1 Tax=Paenibacillus ginsengihumi TaxID=431596 RepID=UPI00036404DD|nr:HNH endonuclease [Paenibacillus ginsengihumi]